MYYIITAHDNFVVFFSVMSKALTSEQLQPSYCANGNRHKWLCPHRKRRMKSAVEIPVQTQRCLLPQQVVAACLRQDKVGCNLWEGTKY